MSTQPTENQRNVVVTEVWNAITHGIATVLSIVALVFLVMKGMDSGNVGHLVAYTVYGASMLLLFLASTLYHSFSFTRFRKLFRYVDHASIYLLIAGSYTPFCLIALKGTAGYVLFSLVWGIALLGLILKVFFLEKYSRLSTILYLVMGWMAVFLIRPIAAYLGGTGMLLFILGGLSYSLGTIFYANKRFSFMHVIWHLFVIAGAAFHYFTILFYV